MATIVGGWDFPTCESPTVNPSQMKHHKKSRSAKKAGKRKEGRARHLSPDELDVLAKRMIGSKSEGEREALQTAIIRGF